MMKKLMIVVAGAVLAFGAFAAGELPEGYTSLSSIRSDGAQFIDLQFRWEWRTRAECDSTPAITLGDDSILSKFLDGVTAEVRSLKFYDAYQDCVCDMVPCVENASGDFGLYDKARKSFHPLVRPAEEPPIGIVEDHETLNGFNVVPGQVLKHNHRYHVTEDTTIDAAAMPGLSAIRVPVGAAAIVDISPGMTLTLRGGPGYGRIPGGAGIEVPRGSKLVVTGGGTLDVTGGDAASGGRGYGGMGGQFSYIQMTSTMDSAHNPYADMPGGYPGDVTNNDVAASSFATNALYFARTGDGGNGGDGGGGAGAGIGTRGGVGGLGGVGPAGKFVIGGKFYEDDKDRYAKFAKFFGMDIRDWYLYDENANVCWDGVNGGAGGDGGSALSCGEIIITGNVTVKASSGAGGGGGENGPFGSTAQAYDKGVKGNDWDSVGNAMSVVNLGLGFMGTALGMIGGKEGAAASTVLGWVGVGLSVVSMILDAVYDDKSTMKKQLWFVGGGGGGGGGGGAPGARIGAGGAGGGAGGSGGGGLFEMGAYSVYTMSGAFIGTKIDATKPPLQLGGHGGFGGAGLADGKTATSLNRGQPEEQRKEKDGPYNCLPFHGDAGDWRLGAASWKAGAEAWCGAGGVGGKAGAENTAAVSLLTNVSQVTYSVRYHRDGNDTNPMAGGFVCGTLVERAPIVKGPNETLHFDGYYTEPDGRGVQYFDRFRNSSGYPKITEDLDLYANWTDVAPAGGFKNVVDGSALQAGALLEDGTIYRFGSSNMTFSTNGAPGLRVRAGATAVIYIDANVTVTCKGSDGFDKTPGQPGIEVPTSSTLIVTGEGKLVATGGNAGNGSQGYDGLSSAKNSAEVGSSQGGAGGVGGGGAGAGIGGAGGEANGSGAFCQEATLLWKDSSGFWGRDGYSGSEGPVGQPGKGSGAVYLLGRIEVEASGGAYGKPGAHGKESGLNSSSGASYTLYAGSSGGGGGGAGGSSGAAIGGGGGAGGDGGAGGGGGLLWRASSDAYSAKGGAGGNGESNDGAAGGGEVKLEGSSCNDWDGVSRSGGKGGAGGVAAANGTNGTLYVNEAVRLTADRKPVVQHAFGHPALERNLTFRLDGSNIVTVAAQIGMALPILPDTCVRPMRGYVLAGACQVTGGVSNWWYKAKGEPAIPQYRGIEDVTLEVVYELDTERMADVPEPVNFAYDGSNHVAFVAAKNPACTYLAGETNGTETGRREYTVRLNDDFTVWSDLVTDRVRTIPWEITRSAITNEWAKNIITYDWTKSHADNWFALTNDPATTLGFKLPPDAQVTFELGEMTQVNEQRLIVRLSGMRNHFDKTYYGAYSCSQPFQLRLRPHYPWAAKLDITCWASSFKISEDSGLFKGFRTNYDNVPIIAQVMVPDGKGGTRIVTLNETNNFTVSDVLMSRDQSRSVTVDLRGVEGLEGVRAYSLPVYVSLDGQVFQGGSTTIDTTATDRDGYPLYMVHDVNDIFDISCSVVFVDEGRSVSFSEAVHSQLAIGTFSETEDRPGGKFVPQTASGELMSDTFVRWTPTRAGDYMLEHWVLNNGVEIGYRRAYFGFHGVDGEEPVTVRNLITRVFVTRAGTGERIDYTSLAAAVAELRYGDAITIVQDVQMEDEKIPSGSTVTVEGDGVFRRTQESDLARPYHTADVTLNANGKVTNAVFRLDDEKVRPSMDGKGLFGLSEGANGREFTFTIGNVKPDLYYIVRRSDDIRTWTVASKVYAAGETDSLTVSLPAETEKGFFSVAVTDDPLPAFRTEDDGSGGVTVKGADTLETGDFAGRLVIPAMIGGKNVTGVGASAFANRADIRSVDVLSGVATLGANAFKWCVNLSSVSLCDGLVTIGDGVFDGTAITELVIPASVAKVGSLDLRGLRTLRFLGKPSEIGNLLLSPDCIVYVPQDAGWAGVPSADWHGGQLEYRVDFTCTTGRVDGVFEVCITGCENIPSDRRLRIPQTIDGMPVAAIGERAFEDKGRSVLTEVIIPEGVREIGGGAFCGCDGLVALELPASLLSLGRCAFGKAENLSSIVSLSFAGNAPDYDGDVYLDPVKCVLGVRVGASGWGDTWQGCRVEFRGADGLIYHPLAYIEAPQGAYVDTLYRPNQNTRVTMDVTVRDEMEYWFGCWTNDYNRGAFCLGNDGEWGIYFAVCDDGGSFFHDGGRVPAGRHAVELTPWEFKVDGTIWAAKPESSRKDFQLDQPLYLFAQNRKGSAFVNAAQGTITCHGCTIGENGSLKRNFVPCCRESDGAYGFYDAVEGVFYGNMGSGMFYGPKDMK